MDEITRIKQEINFLIYSPSKSKKGKTLYEIADHVGKSSSYLSRIASLTEDVPFPIELALKIMKLKKNFRFMNFMAAELGGAFIKLPKFKLSKKEEDELGAEYQKAASEAASKFINFLYEPTESNFHICEEKLTKIIGLSVSARIYARKKNSGQQEIF